MHGFPGHGKAGFNLRAYGNPFDKLPQGIFQIMIELVPAVITDLLAEEA
jgi:hypothetical protein